MNNDALQAALDELYLLQERTEQQQEARLKQFQQSLTEQQKSLNETQKILDSAQQLPVHIQKTLDEAIDHIKEFRWYLSALVTLGVLLAMFIALFCVKGFATSLKHDIEHSQAELVVLSGILQEEQRSLQETKQQLKRLPKFQGQDGRTYVAVDIGSTINRYDKEGNVVQYAAIN